VISRVVRIFEAFTSSRRALTVTELSRLSGLHIATASRLVAELVSHGLLTRTADGRVLVGMRMWELAQRASPTLALREAAMPYLEDLHAVVGHHVQLGVVDGAEVLFLERLSAPVAVVNVTPIAGRLPLHVSASGLVLVAFGPPELQERMLAGARERLTAHTLTDQEHLRRVLAGIRRDGYIVTNGHVHPDASGIAVPIRDARDAVVAALSVIVPNDGQAFAWIPVLRASARGIARGLGARPAGAAKNPLIQ
jgi:DNA-binding IclR family transcriptional regulator